MYLNRRWKHNKNDTNDSLGRRPRTNLKDLSNTPFLGFQPVFGALKQHVHALFEEELVAVKEASTLTEALVIAR